MRARSARQAGLAILLAAIFGLACRGKAADGNAPVAPRPALSGYCRMPSHATADIPLALKPAFAGTKFLWPVELLRHPSDPSRWFVVEHAGMVKEVASNGATRTVVDLRDRVSVDIQWGLQSVALHPQFASNGVAFVAYTKLPPGAAKET